MSALRFTADGAGAVLGRQVYHLMGGPAAFIVGWLDGDLLAEVETRQGQRAPWWLSRTYSSFEAALAARLRLPETGP